MLNLEGILVCKKQTFNESKGWNKMAAKIVNVLIVTKLSIGQHHFDISFLIDNNENGEESYRDPAICNRATPHQLAHRQKYNDVYTEQGQDYTNTSGNDKDIKTANNNK